MKNPWVVALLNFFTLGLGTLLLGKRPWFGLLMFIGAGLLAKVEFSLEFGSQLYWLSFAGFFLLAVATAWDGYREAQDK